MMRFIDSGFFATDPRRPPERRQSAILSSLRGGTLFSAGSRHGLALAILVLWAILGIRSAAAQDSKTMCDAPCEAPALSATPTTTPPKDPRIAELLAVDAEMDRAMQMGDRATVARILDESMFSVDSFDGVRTREKILEAIQPRRSAPPAPLAVSDVEVEMSGDTAVLTAKKTATYHFNGHTASFRHRDTNTYVRRDGGWKLVSSVRNGEDPPYSAADVDLDLDLDPAAALGSPDAPLVVYEFSDYECPICRGFTAQTFPRVEKDYVRTGKVTLVFRDNPLPVHPRAPAAAAAGLCAEKLGKRWPMSEKLLKDPPALSDEDFRRDAREIGLDPAAFERCLSDPATAAKIRRGADEAYELGVKGTPIFLVGVRVPGAKKVRIVRRIDGGQPYEVFQKTLDGLLRARGL